jgi:tetratricopeptide (TPR) repeat protein
MMKRDRNKLYVISICVALALATIIAYEPIHRNDFINYDDDEYVTENPQVTAGITRESLIWAFTTPHVANWHPLTSLSHMLDCQLFGLNAFWHHLVNLLFHIANTLLLFWVLQRMTGAVWASAFVAAAFALHPLHVESVAWVAERKGVLSGFFWMLTMAAYIGYAQRPAIARYMLVFLFFALGLMAKPMVITLPFVLLLLDYWPLERFQLKLQTKRNTSRKIKSAGLNCPSSSFWRLVIEKIPLFVLAIISAVLTLVFQRIGGAIKSTEFLPINLRLANAAVSYIRYIGKMVWPTHLAVFYPHPGANLPLWQPILALMILAGISAVIIHIGRHKRYLTVGWLWYLGTLVPVIGLIQVGSQAMADRYTYLPSIGIFIVVTWGAVELTAQRQHRRFILAISAAVILVVLGVCTLLQLRHWKNNSTLFGHALKVTRDNHIMHSNYGNALMGKGQYEKAIEHFTEALRIDPQYLKARGNLAMAFNKLGVALQKQNKVDQAIEKWKQAIQFDPEHGNTYYNIGLALAGKGRHEQAIKYFKQASQQKPDWHEPYNSLGLAYAQQGREDLAVENYNKALQLKPDYPDAHYNLGCLYYRQGKVELAVSHWTQTARLKPDFVEVLTNLAWILATTKNDNIYNPDEAVKYAKQACELTNHEQIKSLDTLAIAYAAASRFEQAIETTEKAVKLAEADGKKELAEELQKRLELYKAGQPYHEK